MSNIVEQSELLKGIPDDRLSLLLQKPDASIPPFLVAAEAQRRQAIRQQFAGSGTNESVVDTLTKQLSNVPQNIQSPMRNPPQIPPPQMQPQMAGIGALPQGQQAMAGGGPVRRFAPGGYIEPMWKVPDYSGVIPRVGDWVGEKAKDLYEYATTPWGQTETPTSPESPAESSGIDFSIPDITLPNPNPNFGKNGEPSTYTDLTKPKSSTTGTKDTSAENKYKSIEADLRKRVEDLYAVEEPSNWEEAQKWFAMSQAVMNPDQNLIQSLANAGAIYAGAEGQQAADQRAALRDREEALLKWDMEKYSSDRDSEAAGLKARTDIATGSIENIQRERNDISRQMRDLETAIIKGEISDEAYIASERRALKAAYDDAGRRLATFNSYIQDQYGFPIIEEVK